MESTYRALLAHCLDGSQWPAALLDEARRGLATLEGSRQFFGIVIERLGDLFEPRLCDVYARLMADVLGDGSLADRYLRVREVRPVGDVEPSQVIVLSRVTLGADVAVTSVVLDAAKRRFPRARVFLAGPRKNWELFAADPRIEHWDAPYGRSALFADRIAARPWFGDALVLDPDSRLSQLGMLPVTNGEYRLFESRGFVGDGALPELASRWCELTLGVGGKPYVAPLPAAGVDPASATANLGVGENPDKRIADPFEAELLAELPDDTLIDLGGSEAEAQRVRKAAGPIKRLFQGSFADFAWLIQQSRLYVGYDSAGMHVAAACGVPLLCVFAGALNEQFFERWKPTGDGPIEIVRPGPDVLTQSRRAVQSLLHR
ncbi:hypothetical protein F183_A23080 [Bryobacterales bacterium F-183]|nr:hypothetical protein F183_A23080 [Bryobacterales bacterium F-183]